jgi:large subunit ribosomal protein L6
MSRIGKRPIAIPAGVSVESSGSSVKVKGPKGSLTETLPRGIGVSIEGGEVSFTRPADDGPTRALHGLARALVANGAASSSCSRARDQGVGYRAVSGKT